MDKQYYRCGLAQLTRNPREFKMPTVTLTSPIFDKAKRERLTSNFVAKQAKDFKVLTKDRMVRGPATGKLYAKKRGTTFRRSHRASARGQRPSPETGTLVNAITDRRIAENHSQVYIAEKTNPSNGTVASKYGEILQNNLDRPIMDVVDVTIAQQKMERDADVLVKGLI